MGIIALKKLYVDGQLPKSDYIVQMHDYHKMLFEYADFIRTTDIGKIEIEGGEVILTSKEFGIRMVCDRFDRRIAPIETLNFDYYEKNDSNMIIALAKGCDNIFDIGANFGWYSLLLAKIYPGSRLFAFEPVSLTFEHLKNNIALNGLDNIQLFKFGFSDSEKELNFFYYPEGSGNASIANLSDAKGVQSVSCEVKRLDDFTEEKNTCIDFIKCDVEGAELLVFKGGIKSIIKNKPIIFAELLRKWSAKFDYHPNDVISLLRNSGYRCFTAVPGGLVDFEAMDDQTVETNFFFLHEDKHIDKIKLYSH